LAKYVARLSAVYNTDVKPGSSKETDWETELTTSVFTYFITRLIRDDGSGEREFPTIIKTNVATAVFPLCFTLYLWALIFAIVNYGAASFIYWRY
jgi:hypothetical protein